MHDSIVEVKNVGRSFPKAGGAKRSGNMLQVLDGVNFSINEGEIIALLGKSGSGKSTLLRIIAGLLQPTVGQVCYRDQVIQEPMPGLAMVFQHFALMPWLTVLENVELGLEAKGIRAKERRQQALAAIDIVGLDGFESAYPKELSGGMLQRVGIARALVVEPELLLMDEAFSALDVLTAENLRNDLLDIWLGKQTKIKAILLVTHNIEEAVMMADRIIIFNHNPGAIKDILPVNIAHPRDGKNTAVRQLIDEIYTRMTAPDVEPDGGISYKTIDMGYHLPKTEPSEITGFIETLAAPVQAKRIDLPQLAEDLHLDVDDLFPLTEALEILRFADVSTGDIELTPAGRAFEAADIRERKNIFAEHLLENIPIARHIKQALDADDGKAINESQFLSELQEYLSQEDAVEVLATVIDWGRYAEVFAYDYNSRLLSLENPA